MTNNLPFISIIIPCRNEEKYIGKCLDSILNQDYPREKTEILFIDGMSEDKTRETINDYSKKYSFIRLLKNYQKFTPFGLNIGIKEAKGDFIVRMDAHASYEKDYISKCIFYFKKYEVDNVGGIIKTLPGSETIIAKAISLSLSHVFGAGNSYFRIGSKEPQFVDTVFGGCYKKEIFNKIGFFNEKMIRSQDFEFNLRLKQSGGKILLVPSIISYYYSQPTILGFLKHNFIDGFWITYPYSKFKIEAFSWRHLTPLVFILSLFCNFLLSFFSYLFTFLFVSEIFLYVFFNLYFSLKISLRQKDLRYFFILPVIFLIRHIFYGIGSFFGLFNFLKI
jgi:glycosyltransferase involved in cell wall biosynthesis